MPSQHNCCVRDCTTSTHSTDCNEILHSFPHPDKDSDRFRTWLHAIDGDLLVLDSHYIYANRKVCHKHFESKYHTRSNRLSANAVPTLHLKGPSRKRPLSNITDEIINNATLAEPSTSTGPPHSSEPILTKTSDHSKLAKTDSAVQESISRSKCISLKQRGATTEKVLNISNLKRTIKKLKSTKDKYSMRLKKALKLSENITFQKCLQKFTTLAALFTTMQFREIGKGKMGRRFTRDEKIMALSLYKQGPKAYRWLSKIFILPSPVTLSRLISLANLRPGLNKKIFSQLKKRAQSMNDDEKLCILLFDEISISPHYDVNRRRDTIVGFVTNGIETKRDIADHALVFMLRGVIKNYKQPLAYTFCRGTTPNEELKFLVKSVISELQQCGFKVLATVCDQGTTNISAINKLIEETREEYVRRNEDHRHQVFEVNGEEIIPLFDPPHLIKGIRNNLISKKLKCVIDGKVKIAEWDHIIKLHEENPTFKGIRLIKNLTEAHVDPKKIPKMKVKFATQVFSQTVATNMGYLAEKGILPMTCKDTAEVLLFFDELFDSVNGSYDNSKKRSGKILLSAVTPKSMHSEVWAKAKKVLKSMKFVTKDGRECSVPTLNNWLRTLENIEILKTKLFNQFNFKSIWMRHYNQDPLENFFGCIRSHGCRNISPTPAGFESTFTSLLINNMSSNHSIGSNCEDDKCRIFQSMDTLLENEEQITENISSVQFEDMDCEITDFEQKKKNIRIFSQLSYVTGYLLKNARAKIYKNCNNCHDNVIDKEGNEYIRLREYSTTRALTYPSVNIIKMFSQIQDVATYILENKSNLPQIKTYMKTIMYIIIDFNFLTCPDHSKDLVEFLFELSSRFFIFNWCKDVNNLINGVSTEIFKNNDSIKVKAKEYYKKRYKHRKT